MNRILHKSLSVNVKLFGMLRKYVPAYDHNKGVDVVLEEGQTVGDLLNVLGIPENEAHVFFVKGLSRRLTDILHESDEVSIFVQVSGG
ncbi:MAG: MoaD/ThiS family protein [Proteobacteria bacterium]|nr:MoaD/ThiS family protein [Pseudomonadota bacterium]